MFLILASLSCQLLLLFPVFSNESRAQFWCLESNNEWTDSRTDRAQYWGLVINTRNISINLLRKVFPIYLFETILTVIRLSFTDSLIYWLLIFVLFFAMRLMLLIDINLSHKSNVSLIQSLQKFNNNPWVWATLQIRFVIDQNSIHCGNFHFFCQKYNP